MKVLLNLVSPDASIDKRTVTDWALQYFDHHSDESCVIVSSQKIISVSSNVDNVIVKPPQSRSTFYVWKKLTLEPLIRKQHCDVVISWELLRTSVYTKPVLIVSPINARLLHSVRKNRKPVLKVLEKLKSQCKQLIVFSELEKKWIGKYYPHLKDLVQVIHRIPSTSGTILEFEEREIFKEKYSDGNEFFIASAGLDIETLTKILKGFSGFKKWQKSNMELLVSYDAEETATSIRKLLEHYRFNESIKLISKENGDFPKVFASAYAAILPDKYESNFDFLFTALQSQVPVLIPEGSIYAEVAGDAALVYSSNEKEFITKAFLQIFKEEGERSRMIKSGIIVSESWRLYNPTEELFIKL